MPTLPTLCIMENSISLVSWLNSEQLPSFYAFPGGHGTVKTGNLGLTFSR